mmetsp:Transcript_60693/g.112608  ORF Transcript_60693/g.112608 Transcript_60693/m.112608 type:complete len:218 (-) Transcript_60693:63-716(-)
MPQSFLDGGHAAGHELPRVPRLISKKSVQFANSGAASPVHSPFHHPQALAQGLGAAKPAVKQKELLRALRRTRDDDEEDAGDYSLRTPELESSLRSIKSSHPRPSFTNEDWRFHLNYARLKAYRQRINQLESPSEAQWRTDPPQLSESRGFTWRSEPNLQWPLQSIERHLAFGLRGHVLSVDVDAVAPQAAEAQAETLPRRKSVSMSRRIQYAAYTH